MEVRIGAADLHGLVPEDRGCSEQGPPVKFHEVALSLGIHQAEGIDAESLHHPKRAGNGPVRHRPHDHMKRFGHQGYEIPKGVVSAGGLRVPAVGFHLDRMDKVRKFDGVLNKEDRNIVPDQIEVAFLGVEFDGEPADVAGQIHRSSAPGNCRKARKDGRFHLRIGEKRGACHVLHGFVRLKETVRRGAARVDDPFGDSLVIEMRDLFAQDEVFEQCRAAAARFEGVLVVGDDGSLICGEHLAAFGGLLMRLAAICARGFGRRGALC